MSEAVYIKTLRGPAQMLFDAHSTAAAFTARIPTATMPINAGIAAGAVILRGFGSHPKNTRGQGAHVAGGYNLLHLGFCAIGAAGNTLAWRVLGWNQIQSLLADGATPQTLWVPQPLLRGTATIGALTGVAGNVVSAGTRMADTITVSAGEGLEGTTAVLKIQQGTEVSARIMVDCMDFELIEVQMHINGSSTSVNGFASGF